MHDESGLPREVWDDVDDDEPCGRSACGAWVDNHPYDRTASLDDLLWAHGIAFGSPTRFGLPAGQLKEFIDTTGGPWTKGQLVDKVGTAFTSASTAHGGLESTILAMNNVFTTGARSCCR